MYIKSLSQKTKTDLNKNAIFILTQHTDDDA